MTLDKDTLSEAETARDRLLELQHSTEVARVDYHHAIRKLHVAGGSLREIAQALGLSHQRVHQIVEPVDGSSGRVRGGGPMHRMHRRFRDFAPFQRFTEDARAVVVGALEQAGTLGHRRVGTEHLVLSLTASPAGSVTAKALTALGISHEAVAAAVAERLGAGPAGSPGRRPFTPAARRTLERALTSAVERGEKEIRSEHVLLGVVADRGDGADLLASLGASPEQIVAALDAAA